MIGKKMETEFNKQINEEIYSSYLYLSMAAYFDSLSLSGFSQWLKYQAQEEMFHAMKFYHYIVEQDKDVKINGLDQPKQDFKSLVEVFDMAWKHEQHVTKLLNDIMHLAIEEKDYATQSLMKWYIDEQVEEEASMLKILKQLNMVGEKGAGIFMLDAHLKERKFNG